jgi:hypothetical protein
MKRGFLIEPCKCKINAICSRFAPTQLSLSQLAVLPNDASDDPYGIDQAAILRE